MRAHPRQNPCCCKIWSVPRQLKQGVKSVLPRCCYAFSREFCLRWKNEGSIVVEMLNHLSEGNLSDACFEFYLSLNNIIIFFLLAYLNILNMSISSCIHFCYWTCSCRFCFFTWNLDVTVPHPLRVWSIKFPPCSAKIRSLIRVSAHFGHTAKMEAPMYVS